MTGGTGISTVGGDIVFSALNFCPGGYHVTAGAWDARRIIGKIVGTYYYCMGIGMQCRPVLMAGVTGDVWIVTYDFKRNQVRTITESNSAAMVVTV
jgi:hypothetical protein